MHRIFFAILLFVLAAPATFAAPVELTAFEKNVVSELNRLRGNPTTYAKDVAAVKTLFHGDVIRRHEGKVELQVKTQEGTAAVDEAEKVLLSMKPMALLTVANGLMLAARAHAEEQAQTGGIGHDGKDGSKPSQRMKRYGTPKKTGECISYGTYAGDNPKQVVVQLLIDDGVKDRGHRTKMLDGRFTRVGVACGPHPKFQTMCVIDLAESYVEK